MKTIFKILILLSLIPTNGNCQNDGIILTSKLKRHKTAIIKENEYVRISLKDGSVSRGELQLLNDSSSLADSVIIVDHDTIKIADICLIKNITRPFRNSGIILGSTGTIIFTIGLFIVIDSYSFIFKIFGLLFTAVGGSMTITGAILATIGKKYAADRWEISRIVPNSDAGD